jgi:hypothetical protein
MPVPVRPRPRRRTRPRPAALAAVVLVMGIVLAWVPPTPAGAQQPVPPGDKVTIAVREIRPFAYRTERGW